MAVNRQHGSLHSESITWHADNAFDPEHFSLRKDHDLTAKRRAAEGPRENVVAMEEHGLHAGIGDLIRLEETVEKPQVSRLDGKGDRQKQRPVDVPAVVAEEGVRGPGTHRIVGTRG